MDAIELIKGRRSIRRYKSEIVSREDVNAIMDCARFAQSWTNTQVARYTFITDEAVIADLMDRGVQGFGYNIKTLKYAKNVVVLSYVQGKSGSLEKLGMSDGNTGKWEVFDAGIACQTFCLAAHAHGVGTCVMGVIDEKNIAEMIHLPEGESVAALITFGYPAESPEAPPRHSVEKITRFID